MAAQYPWNPGEPLFAGALDAAFAKAYTDAATALATAQAAQAAATAPKPLSATLSFPGPLTAGTYLFTGTAPYPFTITSIDASVGASGGTITANIRNAGSSVGGLSALSITSSTKTNFPASGAAVAVLAGATVDAVLTITGSPIGAFIVLNGVH